MKILCQYSAIVPISELKLNEKNRNIHPQNQIERLAKILEYQGFRYPIKVSNQSGLVVSGHGRILAAQKNGWTEVPVSYQDYENQDQETADAVSDNSIASWAELDLSGINTDLADFDPSFDIDLLGIKDFKIDASEIENNNDVLNQEQFILSILCKNENEMSNLYNEMQNRGLDCKLIT